MMKSTIEVDVTSENLESLIPHLSNTNKGELLLDFCKKGGYIEHVKQLIDAGADVNFKDDYYGTPLMAACKDARVDLVELLLDNGADANLGTKEATPLTQACEEQYDGHPNRIKTVKLLLNAGADVNAKVHRCDFDGHRKTAYTVLELTKNKDLIDMLNN